MDRIVSKLKDYLLSNGISSRQAELSIGVSNGTLSKPFLKGTSIKTDTLEKFLNHYVDFNLIENNSSNFNGDFGPNAIDDRKSDQLNENTTVYKLRTDKNYINQTIPLYNIEATAGLVNLFQNNSDQRPIDTIRIPNLPKCDGALYVTGDSMYPLLKSGDIVAYKKIEDFQNDVFWGEMYLVSVEVAGEEYVSVKYVQKSDKGDDYIKLVSQNQHHQPKDILLKKVRAMALIKASIRINSMQ
ncbi:transcriptional regulator [Winogradskyella phage Peternella_1]|uniref:Transcriptional regulator n=1 Tax=Winogradskyella phage Peternella_1 TaxID=2745699 RepID=A0A8E4ZE13_9CAUD|nr:transcriptional regulator [Winogradskyella phage Peternella_1]QQV91537.1 transcriptional regulator [Winogradskyella phage Peternella_1]